MNPKRFFVNRSAYDFFKRTLEKLPEEARYRFHAIIARAYTAKQNSERDDLPTYSLTKDDVSVALKTI